jgi:hypothetical protein
MINLEKIKFEKTQDNSVGLYSYEAQDIFHSKTGAYSESVEKFINPIKDFIKKDEINILDICYGVGYNSKLALEKLNVKSINIDALEFNKDFVLISPFVYDGIIDDELKYFLLSQIIKNEDDLDELILNLKELSNSKLYDFLSTFTMRFKTDISSSPNINIPPDNKNSKLHNIYYNYMSKNNINNLKVNKYKKSKIDFYYGDARECIFKTNMKYDVVFLDAFSSQKDPSLWTIDFLREIKNRMNNNSVLSSYSKSTPFRSALIKLGFNVSKNIINNQEVGTIASYNSDFVLIPLDDYDFKLIDTKAGITYKDKNLNLQPYEILKNRELEMYNSNKMSHTKFIKLYGKRK